MTSNNYAKKKVYVLSFPNSSKKPYMVSGWQAVVDARGRSAEPILFHGFHTIDGAWKFLRTLKDAS